MKYDLSQPSDQYKAKSRFEYLLKNEKKIELKEVRKPRSLSQNSYLHVVITLYAIAYGCRMNEAKTDLKRAYGLYYEKNGNKYLISSADLDSKQMTEFIDFIRTKSSQEMSYYIPTSEEYLLEKFSLDGHIDRHKEYL